jgi:L-ascorbate metabolism protein UlaG (beta-lactamase superfamily)
MPSSLSVDLTPVRAAAAADILGARMVCPIHYGTFHDPPAYSERPHRETGSFCRRFCAWRKGEDHPAREGCSVPVN